MAGGAVVRLMGVAFFRRARFAGNARGRPCFLGKSSSRTSVHPMFLLTAAAITESMDGGLTIESVVDGSEGRVVCSHFRRQPTLARMPGDMFMRKAAVYLL